MKARIPKQNNPERITASQDRNNFTIELGKPIIQIDEKIQKYMKIWLNNMEKLED